MSGSLHSIFVELSGKLSKWYTNAHKTLAKRRILLSKYTITHMWVKDFTVAGIATSGEGMRTNRSIMVNNSKHRLKIMIISSTMSKTSVGYMIGF